jgi:hypothetical protein
MSVCTLLPFSRPAPGEKPEGWVEQDQGWSGAPIFDQRETVSRCSDFRSAFTRLEEGCLVVEMEAAALLAVGKFRHVPVGVYLSAGDDIAGSKPNESRWRKDLELHANLLRLAASAANQLAEAHQQTR